ncbi:cytochrome c oxidase assembly protein [Rhodopila sp.]|jgi:cytochrome c oxidase assembly protein subunit 11|uniref:cytochrome c oxidase assembly protein n=1 Tax=Rhodopila sp. TaxID=2480087 RepID=UPI002C78BD64|nr:cytochrome c oxidase assembly protein [Rhodopila sp.]HVZ08789.1 cytochrome c oxidase assembly protein [Rhodopila sp.]
MGGNRRNAMLAGVTVLVMVGMLGMSFAAIPLYKLFCAVTGFGGTPAIGLAQAPGAAGGTIRIRFNADTNPKLPWRFLPDRNEVTVTIGEEQVAFYRATNLARQPETGMALYNITPEKAAKYFHKTACFCFNKQTLQAGQTMEFPVSFWVDPAIRDDPSAADIKTITLSYTFFRSLEDAEKTGALARAGPHVGPMSEQERDQLLHERDRSPKVN